MWNLVLVYLDKALISVQDRCTVCGEHTTSSENILYAHDGTTRLLGPCEISFWSKWSTVCAERTIGSEIVLDARDGTAR
jgi:coenzyme F420-reducing hydrogenase beta subunit